MNRYKKSANTRRNEWLRSRRKQALPLNLRMAKWVALPVSKDNHLAGDLSQEPITIIELRKQEADQTNWFLAENDSPIRYEPYSTWVNYKWKKK